MLRAIKRGSAAEPCRASMPAVEDIAFERSGYHKRCMAAACADTVATVVAEAC